MPNSSPPSRDTMPSPPISPTKRMAVSFQNHVAGGMSEDIVDRLEAIQIDQADDRRFVRRSPSLALQFAKKAAAVGKAGQLVLKGIAAIDKIEFLGLGALFSELSVSRTRPAKFWK